MITAAPDSPQHSALALGATILVGVLCALLANSLPVFLPVLAQLRGFTDSQTGLAAMADMGGYALGIVVCASAPALVIRLNWRGTAALGALILVAANIMAVFTPEFVPFLGVRFCAGFGAGVTTAIVYAVLAEGDGARLMALLAGAMLISGAITVLFLSSASARFGAAGVFGIYAGCGALALLTTPLVPAVSVRHHAAPAHASQASERITPAGWLAVGSVFVQFIAIGAVYGFISNMGVAWGSSEQAVELSLSKMLFAGLIAVVLVALLGSRLGSLRALLFGYAGLLVSLALFLWLKPLAAFLAITMLFGFSYNFLTPYQFEVVTRVDESSSAAMLVSAGIMGGIAIGPAIAGYLVTTDYRWVNGMSMALTVIALGLMVAALRLHERAMPPAAGADRR